MTFELLSLLAIVGLFGGLVLGLTGTGSSTLILPALVLGLPRWLHLHNLSVHIAVATSMATIFIAACVTCALNLRLEKAPLHRHRLLAMNAIVLPAALLGSFISHLLDKTVLSLCIGALLFFVAGLMLLKQTDPLP